MPSEARHPRDGAEHGARSARPGPVQIWDLLDRDRRLAAVSAVLLFATMLLPWYQQNAVVSSAKSEPLVSRNLNAFAVFSFVEAAVLLVAIAVLALLYERAAGRRFQLPGGDGAVVFAAGIWTALLLVLRLFDKPGITHNGVAANVGVQWGIFFALGAAGLLAYAGSRMRASQRPEPPLLRRPRRAPREDPHEDDATAIVARRAERDFDATTAAATEVVAHRDRPRAVAPVPARERRAADDEPLTDAGLPEARDAPEPPAPRRRSRLSPSPSAGSRPGAGPAGMDQLSFDDTDPGV